MSSNYIMTRTSKNSRGVSRHLKSEGGFSMVENQQRRSLNFGTQEKMLSV